MKRVLRGKTARRWRSTSISVAFAPCGVSMAHATSDVASLLGINGNNTWTVTGNGDPATPAWAACKAAAHARPTSHDATVSAMSATSSSSSPLSASGHGTPREDFIVVGRLHRVDARTFLKSE